MTRFLKRVPQKVNGTCGGCVFANIQPTIWYYGCYFRIYCGDGILTLVPRPPDGTRCRDLEGNLKIVGVDV